MGKRTYKLTEKQKKVALKWYKKGYTTHGKLSKKLGVSRQKVSNWLKERKLGKRVVSKFWEDVKHERELYGRSWKKSKTKVKYSKKWFERRQKRLTGIAKERDIYGEKWQRIKEGEIGEDWWKTEEGEELMESAGYD